MDPLFVLDERFFGRGPLVYAWEPAGSFLAACGTNRKVHLFNGRGVIQRTLTHASNVHGARVERGRDGARHRAGEQQPCCSGSARTGSCASWTSG